MFGTIHRYSSYSLLLNLIFFLRFKRHHTYHSPLHFDRILTCTLTLFPLKNETKRCHWNGIAYIEKNQFLFGLSSYSYS